MRDILFITPTLTENILTESVGPLLLATILRQKGIESHILSFSAFGNTKDYPAFFARGMELICEKQPKILSFYTRSDCYHIMLAMAEEAKKRLGCTVVFGGPHGDIIARETMEEIPYVDFICCGEGETTVYPLFSSILRGEPDLSVPGLVYRRDGQVVMNPRPQLVEDLDTIPFLDYSIFPEDACVDNKLAFPIDVGRGCPFGCTFCSTKTFWGRKYRLKSPQRIVEELRHYNELFGVRYFVFQHDMFTMNKKLVMETCRLIKELPFRASWSCSARLDCVDKELIDVMKDAGLKRIYFGIETGSPRMQKVVNKNLKLECVQELLEYTCEQGIKVTASFIYGFPEEREEDVSYTLDLAAKLILTGKVLVQMHRCAFLPGTALFEQYREELRPTERICDMTGDIGVKESTELFAKHPRLFMYFNEYHTDLREKLVHLPVFLETVEAMPLIYRYYLEKYSPEEKLQLYYDFVEANEEILRDSTLRDWQKNHRIIENDGLRKKFADDPYATVITELYRIYAARLRAGQEGAKPFGDFYSISPRVLEECTRLQDVPQCWCMVTWSKDEKNDIVMQIRST